MQTSRFFNFPKVGQIRGYYIVVLQYFTPCYLATSQRSSFVNPQKSENYKNTFKNTVFLHCKQFLCSAKLYSLTSRIQESDNIEQREILRLHLVLPGPGSLVHPPRLKCIWFLIFSNSTSNEIAFQFNFKIYFFFNFIY